MAFTIGAIITLSPAPKSFDAVEVPFEIVEYLFAYEISLDLKFEYWIY